MHKALPIGDLKPDEIAKILGFKSKKAFYKKLRELGWLTVDTNGIKHGLPNLPKKQIAELNYAYKLQCSYGVGANKEEGRSYWIPIFTQKGLDALKKILQEGQPMESVIPPAKKLQAPAVPPTPRTITPNKIAADHERQEALKNLREMGIV